MATLDADIRLANEKNNPLPGYQIGIWRSDDDPTEEPAFRIEVTDEHGLVHFEFDDAEFDDWFQGDIVYFYVLTGEDPPAAGNILLDLDGDLGINWDPSEKPSFARNVMMSDYSSPLDGAPTEPVQVDDPVDVTVGNWQEKDAYFAEIQVVDSSAETPIAGLQVGIFDSAESDPNPFRTGITDADGIARMQFTKDDYLDFYGTSHSLDFRVFEGNAAPTGAFIYEWDSNWQPENEPSLGRTLQITRARSLLVSGRLADATSGSDIRGVLVEFRRKESDADPTATTLTDEEGNFRFVWNEPALAGVSENSSLTFRKTDGTTLQVRPEGGVYDSKISFAFDQDDEYRVTAEVDAQATDGLTTTTYETVGILTDPSTASPLVGWTMKAYEDLGSGNTILRRTAVTNSAGRFVVAWEEPSSSTAQTTRTMEFELASPNGGITATLSGVSVDFTSDTFSLSYDTSSATLPGDYDTSYYVLAEQTPYNAVPDSPTDGDYITPALEYRKAVVQDRLASMFTMSLQGEWGSDFSADIPQPPSLPKTCGCGQCETLFSKSAYLAQLVRYAEQRVQISSAAATINSLATALGQPLDEFPVDCDFVETEIDVARIGSEVLRTKIEEEHQDSGSTPSRSTIATDPHVAAYRKRAYLTLLAEHGTSYEELQSLPGAASMRPGATERRSKLATQLGIDESHLDALLLDIEVDDPSTAGAVSEDKLEQLFGLPKTEADSGTFSSPLPDPLRDVPKPDLQMWQEEYLKQRWASVDRPQSGEAQPIIDPDLVTLSDVVTGTAAETRLSERGAWLENRLAAITSAIDGATSTGVMDAALDATSGLGLTAWTSELQPIAQKRADGDVTYQDDLAVHFLTVSDLDFLTHLQETIDQGTPLNESQKASLASVLVNAEKHSQHDTWISEEQQDAIVLGPEFFALLDHREFQILLTEKDRAFFRRFDLDDRRDWVATLRQRTVQWNNLATRIADANTVVDERVLPILRQALVDIFAGAFSNPPEDREKRATWIGERLLIALDTEGVVSTRVDQAISSLQALFYETRVGTFSGDVLDVDLDPYDFDDIWPWLGRYNAWRSAMRVFTYPEEFLEVSERRESTGFFDDFQAGLVAQSPVSEGDVCSAVDAYEALFSKVSSLRVQASCQVREAVAISSECSRQKFDERDMLYQFAADRGTLWATKLDIESGKQTPWQKLYDFGDIDLEVAGAVAHQGALHVYAYNTVEGRDKLSLEVKRVSKTLGESWEEEPTFLSGPASLGGYDLSLRVARQAGSQSPVLVYTERFGTQPRVVVGFHENQSESDLDPFDQIQWNYDVPIGFEEFATKYFEEMKQSVSPSGFDHRFEPPNTDGGTPRYELMDALRFSGHIVVFVFWSRQTNQVFVEALAFLEETDRMAEFHGYLGVGRPLGTLVLETTENGVLKVASVLLEGLDGEVVTQEIDFSDLDLSDSVAEGPKTLVSERGSAHRIRRLQPHCGPVDQPSPATGQFLSYSGEIESRWWGSFAARFEVSDPATHEIVVKREALITPTLLTDKKVNLSRHLGADERGHRRRTMQNTFDLHASIGTNVTMEYLREAYLHVPMTAASLLRDAGLYTASLDWLRTLYDYQLTGDDRRIYAGLNTETWRPASWELESWLEDPIDPHALATLRPSALRRFILLEITKTLVELADQEFRRGTADSVPRARELYETALTILDEPELSPQPPNGCALDQLEEDVRAAVSGDHPWLETAVARIRIHLLEIRTPSDRSSARQTTLATIGDWTTYPTPPEQLLAGIAEAKSQAAQLATSPETVAQKLAAADTYLQDVRTYLEQYEEYRRALAESQQAAESRFLRGVSSVAQADYLTVTNNPASVSDASFLADSEALTPIADAFNASFESDEYAATTSEREAALDGPFRAAAKAFVPRPLLSFCAPTNPLFQEMEAKVEAQLQKIRRGLTYGGLRRPSPLIRRSGLDVGRGLNAPGARAVSEYRYQDLIARAREVLGAAASTEREFFSALQQRDAAAYELLQAEQDLEQTRSAEAVAELRVKAANIAVDESELHRDKAQIRQQRFNRLIDQGLLEDEAKALEKLQESKDKRQEAIQWEVAAAIAGGAASLAAGGFAGVAGAMAGASSAAAAGLNGKSQVLSAEANILNTKASYTRREERWRFQQGLAEKQVEISESQIKQRRVQASIANIESNLAQLRTEQASARLEFLNNKFGTLKLYQWMVSVLRDTYRQLLFEATDIAKLAWEQLVFERQETIPSPFSDNYWTPAETRVETPENTEGITGSTQLRSDIEELESVARRTNERRLQMTKSLSLSAEFPRAFNRLISEGILEIETSIDDFDRDFPGHYQRLIEGVKVSVIGLLPQPERLHGSLSSSGFSSARIEAGSDTPATIIRSPQRIELTTAVLEDGIYELEPQSELLRPFEGLGVATDLTLELPKPAQEWSLSSIVDVIVHLDYSAKYAPLRKTRTLSNMPSTVESTRSFSIRSEFPDQWYTISNEPITDSSIELDVEPRDFIKSSDGSYVQDFRVFFVLEDPTTTSMDIGVAFVPADTGSQPSDDPQTPLVQTVDQGEAIASTRRSPSWSGSAVMGETPLGTWHLSFPTSSGDHTLQQLLDSKKVNDIVLEIDYAANVGPWT
jgi:hypothetical protein